MFYKKDVLKNFVIFTGKRSLESLFNKIVEPQVFSCGYCEIFKNIYLEEYLRTAAFRTPENLDLGGTKWKRRPEMD